MPRKPKRRKWGSIHTLSRGKHVLRWVENAPEGRKRRCFTFYGTEAEACLWLDRKHVEVSDKGDRPVPTIGRAYREWWRPALSRKLDSGKIKPRTFEAYQRAWKVHAERRWRDVPVTQVRPIDVQDWLLGMTEGDAKIAITVMKGIMDYPVKYGLVESNKFRMQYELPGKSRTRAKDVLTLPQAEETLRLLHDKPSEAPCIVACFGGARTAEALAARSDELETVEAHGVRMALVPIVRMVDGSGDGILEWTKTDESRRKAIVPEPCCDALMRAASGRSTPWLANRGDGLPPSTGTFWRTWRADAPGCVPFANLRPSWRTFAELVWKVPYDVLEILMGHKLKGVTGRHCMRPTEADLVNAFAEAYAAHSGKVR